MTPFRTMTLPSGPDCVAPDGFEVRLLSELQGGGMAQFCLPAGQVSKAVTHRTVEEIWFFVSGRGEAWRKQEGREEVTPVRPGVSVTIPLGTHFQFRALGEEPLTAIAVTMPPWPGEVEAILVRGRWKSTMP
ncbi:MAG TPA: cupin domain-containing protein [Thermodesulfobacteriota bacterium]|nr:cupin domain-containing protein [Thermodesulfobacteriota bacterium]